MVGLAPWLTQPPAPDSSGSWFQTSKNLVPLWNQFSLLRAGSLAVETQKNWFKMKHWLGGKRSNRNDTGNVNDFHSYVKTNMHVSIKVSKSNKVISTYRMISRDIVTGPEYPLYIL